MFRRQFHRPLTFLSLIVIAIVLAAVPGGSQVGQRGVGTTLLDMPDTGVAASDGAIAAGYRHLVSAAEGRFRILTKEGDVVRDVALDSFFNDQSFNFDVVLPSIGEGCGATIGTFGPRALYDEASDRFFVLAAAGDRTPNRSRYLLSVSRTADPTDGFCCYDFNGSGWIDRSVFRFDQTWADYPTLGVNDVAIFFGSNQMSGENEIRSRMNWLAKDRLLRCEPPGVLFGTADLRHSGPVSVGQAFSVQPAHSFGPTTFVDKSFTCTSDRDCGGNGSCILDAPVCAGTDRSCNPLDPTACGSCDVNRCTHDPTRACEPTDPRSCGTCPPSVCAHDGRLCDPRNPGSCGRCDVNRCTHDSTRACDPAQPAACGSCRPSRCAHDGTLCNPGDPASCGECGPAEKICDGDWSLSGDSPPLRCEYAKRTCDENSPDPTQACDGDADCGFCLARTCSLDSPDPSRSCSADGQCGVCGARTCDDASPDTTQVCDGDADCGFCPSRTCSLDSPDPTRPCSADGQCGVCGERLCTHESVHAHAECWDHVDCGRCVGVCEFQQEFLAASFVDQGSSNDAVTVWRIEDPLGLDRQGRPTFRIVQRTLTPPEIDPFDNPLPALQPGSVLGGPTLDTGDGRLLNLLWRSPGNLWTSHNGAAFDCTEGELTWECAAVLVKEFGTRDFPAVTVPQDLVFGQDGLSNFNPALAVLEGNQVSVGYTQVDTQSAARAAWAIRSPSTPTAGNLLNQVVETVPGPGVSYRRVRQAATQSWGSYRGASADVCSQKGAWAEGQAVSQDGVVDGVARQYETFATNLFADPPPTNNVCEGAKTVDFRRLPFRDVLDTTFATFEEVDRDVQDECGSFSYAGNDGSVWYRFTAPRNGELTIDTSGSNYGTVVSVHHETGACSGFGQVACEVCEQLYGIDSSAPLLYRLDPRSGALLTTLNLTVAGREVKGGTGLATNPVTGELWALLCLDSECGGRGINYLAVVDPATGIGDVIGSTGDQFSGIAFDRSGVLYGVTGFGAGVPRTLYTLSTVDGRASAVCPLALQGSPGGVNIAYNTAQDALYLAYEDDSDAELVLERIDDLTVDPCRTTGVFITPDPSAPVEEGSPRGFTFWEQEDRLLLKVGSDGEPMFNIRVDDSLGPNTVNGAVSPNAVNFPLGEERIRGLALHKCVPGDPGDRIAVPVVGGEDYRIVVSECGLASCGGDKILQLEVDFIGGTCGNVGQACDDLDPCTDGDQCVPGVGAVLECAGARIDAPCDDGEVCTTDSCDVNNPIADPNTGCFHTFNFASCDDGVFCNGEDSCLQGACIVHNGDPCPGSDGDDDCGEACDEEAGACTAPDPDGTICNDGIFCNGTDRCQGGLCSIHSDPPCPNVDDDDCGQACDEVAGACIAEEPDGSPCDDGVFCNGVDRCLGGACDDHEFTGGATPCDDNPFCSNVCDEPNARCQRPDGTTCSDELSCTLGDTCQGGQCVPDSSLSPCLDGELCVEELSGTCVPCVSVSQVEAGGTVRCGINRPCALQVRIATNDVEDAFIFAARQDTSQVPIVCESQTCRPGSAVPTGQPGLEPVCTLNETCSFFVLQPDQSAGMGFQDGQAAELPVMCNAPAQGVLSLADVQVSNGDGELVPLCAAPESAAFVCQDCLAGDCIPDGKRAVNDAICELWCALDTTMRLEAEARGWDCSCAGDCNCDGASNILDALCSLQRLTNGGRLPGVDPCAGGSAELLVTDGEPAGDPVRVRVSRARAGARGRSARVIVSLGKRGAEDVAAMQARLLVEGGEVVAVRLPKRLRDAGFTIATGQAAGVLEVGVLPPASSAAPAAGGGRLIRIVVSDTAASVKLGSIELASTAGVLVPTR